MKYIKRIMFLLVCIIPHAHHKTWNFMVHVAANNDLYRHALQNIKQMQHVGSTHNINIFVQLDNFGKQEVFIYKIARGRADIVTKLSQPPASISGTRENLFAFAKEVITKYPADHQALILWNHGSGALDPHIWSRNLPFDRDRCFFFNPATHLYEINRGLHKSLLKGIAFNYVSHTYLTNPDLKHTLERIKTELLGGKNIDLLGMDACHMAMIEIASQAKHTADYLVGSQEIVPGSGWDYTKILRPFQAGSFTPTEFAKHIVHIYDQKYNHLFADLTHSAIDLNKLEPIERNIDALSCLLLKLAKTNPELLHGITKIRDNESLTTAFLDINYIDLAHFYQSLYEKIDVIVKPSDTVTSIKTTIMEGLTLIDTCVIKNSTGAHIRTAQGISIYFPTRSIHSSYLKNEFSKITNWTNFLYTFLKHKHNRAFI